MLTLRTTCTLTLTVVTVACAFPACMAKEPPWAGEDDSGAAASSSSSPSSSNGGASSSSGTGSSSGKPGSSGSSSGTSTSGGSGSSTGGGSSGSAHTDSGTSSSSGVTCDPDGGQVPTNVMFSGGYPTCVGTKGCNLTTNVCCVDTGGVIPLYSCIAKSQQCSNASTSARFECVQKSDCPGDEVCCLQADQTAMTAGSVCMDVSDAGGKCSPPTTSTRGSAQLCQTDRECKSGGGCCIWQNCTVMGNALQFTMCGLQNSSVFTCTPH